MKVSKNLLKNKGVDVDSSNVKRVAYDAENKVLVVEFLKGHIYGYCPVEESTYSALINAESKGKYLHQHIVHNKALAYEKLK